VDDPAALPPHAHRRGRRVRRARGRARGAGRRARAGLAGVDLDAIAEFDPAVQAERPAPVEIPPVELELRAEAEVSPEVRPPEPAPVSAAGEVTDTPAPTFARTCRSRRGCARCSRGAP
jgi:hypothetical protein